MRCLITTVFVFVSYASVLCASPIVGEIEDLDTMRSLGIKISVSKPDLTYHSKEKKISVVWDAPEGFKNVGRFLGNGSVGVKVIIFQDDGSVVFSSAIHALNLESKASKKFNYNPSSSSRCFLYFGEPGSLILRLDLNRYLEGMPKTNKDNVTDWKELLNKAYPESIVKSSTPN